MKVIVYCTTTCPYCEMLMDYLEENKVEYEKKLVDENIENKKEMMAISDGFLGVPYTVIEKGGSVESVIGFDKNKIDDVLDTNQTINTI